MKKLILILQVLFIMPFLFANNNVNDVQIYFETFGGNQIGMINLSKDNDPEIPKDIQRFDGTIFLGWYDSLLFDNQITNISSINSSMILFARWEINYHFEITEGVPGPYGIDEFGYYEYYLHTGEYLVSNEGINYETYSNYVVLFVLSNTLEMDPESGEHYYPMISRNEFTMQYSQKSIIIDENHILNFQLIVTQILN